MTQAHPIHAPYAFVLDSVEPEHHELAAAILAQPAAAKVLSALGGEALRGGEPTPLSNFITERFVEYVRPGPWRFVLRHADYLCAAFRHEIAQVEGATGSEQKAQSVIVALFAFFAAGKSVMSTLATCPVRPQGACGSTDHVLAAMRRFQELYGGNQHDMRWDGADLLLAA